MFLTRTLLLAATSLIAWGPVAIAGQADPGDGKQNGNSPAPPRGTNLPDDPSPPIRPGYEGEKRSHFSCGFISVRGEERFVELEYVYEWRRGQPVSGAPQARSKTAEQWVLVSEGWRTWPDDASPHCR